MLQALLVALAGCAAHDTTTGDIVAGGGDAGVLSAGAGAAGAACTTGAGCVGGACLGAPGQPQFGNRRFDGGYCTHIGCTANTQDGCGADEYCVDGGGGFTYCVKLCSKAGGSTCPRADEVCPAGYVCSRIGYVDPISRLCPRSLSAYRPRPGEAGSRARARSRAWSAPRGAGAAAAAGPSR